MNHTLLIAIFSGLGGMVGWGSADFFAKKTINRIGDLRTLFWAQMVGLIPLSAYLIAHPNVPNLNHFDPLFLVLFGIVSALSYLLLYSGFGKGQVSLLSPIFAAYSVVVVILAAIFLGTGITSLQWLAIAIVFIGILLLSTDPREARHALKLKGQRSKGVAEVFVAMLVYSLWLLYLDKFLSNKDWLYFLLIIRGVAVVTLMSYAFLTRQDLHVPDKKLWKYLGVIGLFDVAAFSAVSYGFSHTSYIGIVTVLSATFSLVTMLLAFLFLHERIKGLQLVAAGFVICGIVIISLG